ncbi:MAG TPA: two-component regulator propeller domain-containing protein [Ohtaekwangia sp.]|nr:two-component regulator propeller domain-containing protein [Ohtaekwangia sp.]
MRRISFHIAWMYKSLLLLLAMAFFADSNAQLLNLEFEAYNTTKGLSHNHVFSIAQDKEGFLWVGTNDGLNRFDGYDFKVFRHDPDNPQSLADNSVHALCVGNDSTLWIGTTNGICRYFPRTETFERYPVVYPDSNKISGASVSDIRIHPNGTVWVSYIGDGVNVIDPANKTVTHYAVGEAPSRRLNNNLVASILFMPDGDVLLGTLGGLQIIDKNGRVVPSTQALARYPWKDSIDHSIRTLTLSRDRKTIWIGTELQGLYHVDLPTGKVMQYTKDNSGLEFNHILSLYEDKRGTLWVGSEAIYLFDRSAGTLVQYNEYGIAGSLQIRNPVYTIFEDRDNNIWMGTFRLGLLKYNPFDTRVLHYHTNLGEGSIQNNEVLSFSQDSGGKVWIGTGGAGLYRLENKLKAFDQPARNDDFSSKIIKCIYKDPKGNLWLGTWEGGFMRYHPGRDELEIFSEKTGNFHSANVWDIAPDHTGNLWLGSLRDGLSYFLPVTRTVRTTYTHDPSDPASLASNDILSLHVDRRNNLWVGTGNGLSILEDGKSSFRNFRSTGKPGAIPNNIILCIYEDSQGKMWIGTNGGGITIFNSDFTVLRTIGEKDGLPSATVASIQPDDRGNLWLGTYNGLAKINPVNMAITEVPQIIGLQGREFVPRSSFKDDKGRLFFGGINGFNLFHPDSLIFDPVQGKVVLTDLKIQNDEIRPNREYNGKTILAESITVADAVEFSYKDYAFTISFSSLTYNWQKSVRYAYMLENLDDEWQYTSAERRFVHYTNLAPGKYTLHVKASFDGVHWPDHARILRIIVAPPWWNTLWFKSFAIVFFLSGLYALYWVRVRFLTQQRSKLEGLVEDRTRALQKSNAEIKNLLAQVARQRDSIEEKNHQLTDINDAIAMQRDSLEEKSVELEKTQAKLKEINEDLEKLVSERTQKLNDTVKELETFLYRASHDIRGPISSMLGLIEVTRLEPDHEKFYRVYNEFLHKTVLQLDRTLQKLLEKHIIERNEVVYETLNKEMVLKILHNLLKSISYFRPDFFRATIEDGTLIRTDRMLLTILLSNLLENAFFFSTDAENKNVQLDIKRNGNETLITVTDFGPGISHVLKDKIFDMFYRGNVQSSGNGLGLYLVKCALDKIKGTIELETKEGVYTCFVIRLPD